MVIKTDASFAGFGAVKGEDWLAGLWQCRPLPSYLDIAFLSNHFLLCPALGSSLVENINFIKLIAAVIAILVWAPTLTGSRVVLYIDNQSTVSFLTKCTTKNIAAIAWLKKLFYASSKHNFDVTACHISGANNVLPDALSRLVESQSHMRMFLTDFPYSLPWSDLPINSFSYPFVTSAKDGRQATSQRDG